MIVQGKWHPPGSAARYDATLTISSNGRYVLNIDNGEVKNGYADEINVKERLANVNRKLSFNDESVFSTDENDIIDQLFPKQGFLTQVVHKIETNLMWVLVALIVTVTFSFSIYKWGIPWASTTIAHALPQKANEIIGAGAADFLDNNIFEPSELSAKQQEEIRTRFTDKILPLFEGQTESPLKLHFRNWVMFDEPIANALALPSGDIILTDKFVELAENTDEIDAVIMHEVGHIMQRHSLEMLVQSTLLTTAIVLITGGVDGGGALADLGIGLGSSLIYANYSQEHETEADQFAYEYSFKANIDPIALSTILERMEQGRNTDDLSDDALDDTLDKSLDKKTQESALEEANEPSNKEVNVNDKKGIIDHFSTHPSTTDRANLTEHYSNCFNQGISYQQCKTQAHGQSAAN